MKLAELLKNDTMELINKSRRLREMEEFPDAELEADGSDEYDPDDADAEGTDYEAVAQELIAAVEQDGGFTVEANSFTPANLRDGYQVAIEEYESHANMGDIAEIVDALKEINAYINQQSSNDLYVGGWYDEEAGELGLEVSQYVPELSFAMALAKQRNQNAIFDNRNMTDVPVYGAESTEPTEDDGMADDEYADTEVPVQ